MQSDTPTHPAARWIVPALFLLTAVTFSTAVFGEFVNFDDDLYVTANHRTRQGLTLDNVRWALTTLHAANWQPVAWFSHMIDVELFGVNPAGHKAHNVFLHAVNTCLCFYVLRRLTGTTWRSAAVAVLYAVHPLRVEAVAWVAERKELLASLFGLLSILAYSHYARRRSWRAYTLVAVFFLLSLAAKAMFVTLPFVLLLLDFWPLGRMHEDIPGVSRAQRVRGLVLEKLPLLALSIVVSVATVIAQQDVAMHTLETTPFTSRVWNAAVAYSWYVQKTLLPTDLTVMYPFRKNWPFWRIAAGVSLLLVVSALAWRFARRIPYLFVGWFFFVGTLVPVIGIVQVGATAYADRYAYVPQLGLFIAIVWGAADLLKRFPLKPVVVGVCAAGLLAALVGSTWIQIGFWRSSEVLWGRCIVVDENNAIAMGNLGSYYVSHKQDQRAAYYVLRALALDPQQIESLDNFAVILLNNRQFTEAKEPLLLGLQKAPRNLSLRMNLGVALIAEGNEKSGMLLLEEVLREDPTNPPAHVFVGRALRQKGDIEGAVASWYTALRYRPELTAVRVELADALVDLGRIDEAIAMAQSLRPGDAGYETAQIVIKRARGEWPTTTPATSPSTAPAADES